jgi:hypothetical protein
VTPRRPFGIIVSMATRSMRGTARWLLVAAGLSACAEPGETDLEPVSTTSTGDSGSSSIGDHDGDTSIGDDAVASSSGDGETAAETTAMDDANGGSSDGTFGMPAEPMPCPADIEPSTLEIGHGSGQFLDLVTGPAQLVHGRQGGFHIVLGVRAPGLDTSGPGTANLRGTVDGQVLADHPFVANLVCEDEAVGAQALWINLVLESTPAELHGKTVAIDVEIVDAQGASVSGSAEVEIVDREAAGP